MPDMRVEASRRSISPGRARVLITLVGMWVIVQGLAVSNQSLANSRGVWSVIPISTAACAALIGFSIGQHLKSAGSRVVAFHLFRFLAPSFALVIVITMIVIGSMFTNDRVADYIRDPQTWVYLLNLIGWPQYSLPGVFSTNPVPEIVNQNVWIAPSIAGIMLIVATATVRLKLRLVPLALAVLLATGALVAQALDLDLGDPGSLSALFLRADGLGALLAGIVGFLLYQARRLVALNTLVGAAAALIIIAIALAGNAGWRDLPPFRIAVAVLVGYASLTAANLRWSPSPLATRLMPALPGFLLLSFPLQQAAVAIAPSEQAGFYAIVLGSGGALVLAVATWEAIGRRLISSADRSALAEAMASAREAANDRRSRSAPVDIRRAGAWLLAGLAFILLSLGLAALIYVAFQPDRGGI